MSLPVFVFDPTASDTLSKVRGVGRYLQILKENLPEATFTSDLRLVPFESVLINPFFNLIQPPTITKRIAKKQIAIVHDLIPLKYPSHFPIGLKGTFYVWRNKQLLSLYEQIITNSKVSKNDIVTRLRVKESKVKIINPCLPNLFYNTTKISPIVHLQPKSYFIYVGDATWNKNLVNMAKAVSEADVTCVCVGKVFTRDVDLEHPWNKEYQSFRALTQHNSHFIFPGYIADQDLLGLYKEAIANILISRDEGFGFSYLEAASQGTPSLLSDVSIFHEINRGGARFVNPENVPDIANELKNIAKGKKSDSAMNKQLKECEAFYSAPRFKEAWQKAIFD